MRDQRMPAPGETAWPTRVAAAARDAGLPNPTAGHLPPASMDVDDLLAPWLVQCGRCDAGLPMGCVCPTGDVRPLLRQLANMLAEAGRRIDGLQDTLERERRNRLGDHALELRRIAASPTDMAAFLTGAALGPDAHPAEVLRAVACRIEDLDLLTNGNPR
jgi:hypothetical protein